MVQENKKPYTSPDLRDYKVEFELGTVTGELLHIKPPESMIRCPAGIYPCYFSLCGACLARGECFLPQNFPVCPGDPECGGLVMTVIKLLEQYYENKKITDKGIPVEIKPTFATQPQGVTAKGLIEV